MSASRDKARRERLPWIPLALTAAAWLCSAGCSSAPREAASPYQEAAAAEAKSAQEAYGEGRMGGAVLSLRESVRLRLAGGDLPGAARSELNLALAERASADPAAAAQEATRLRGLTPGAVQQVREEGGPAAEAREAELEDSTSWMDALLALDRGDTERAESGVPGRDGRLAANSQMRGRIENLHAAIALRAGRFAEAGALARAGREASSAAADPAEEAHAWRLAGAADAGTGAWPAARSDYLAAIRIEERIGGGTRMAGDLRQLALVSERLGDSANARLYTQRADAIQSSGAAPR